MIVSQSSISHEAYSVSERYGRGGLVWYLTLPRTDSETIRSYSDITEDLSILRGVDSQRNWLLRSQLLFRSLHCHY